MKVKVPKDHDQKSEDAQPRMRWISFSRQRNLGLRRDKGNEEGIMIFFMLVGLMMRDSISGVPLSNRRQKELLEFTFWPTLSEFHYQLTSMGRNDSMVILQNNSLQLKRPFSLLLTILGL